VDYKKLLELLDKNKDKEFVQRILNPSKYPTLDLGDGTKATHLMAWGEQDGKYYAYPTVLMNKKGELEQQDPDTAFKNVMQSGDYIEFDDPDEADWFTKNYKMLWGR